MLYFLGLTIQGQPGSTWDAPGLWENENPDLAQVSGWLQALGHSRQQSCFKVV